MDDGGGAELVVNLAIEGLCDGAEVGHSDSGGLLNIVNGLADGSWLRSRHRQGPWYCLRRLRVEETDLESGPS